MNQQQLLKKSKIPYTKDSLIKINPLLLNSNRNY